MVCVEDQIEAATHWAMDLKGEVCNCSAMAGGRVIRLVDLICFFRLMGFSCLCSSISKLRWDCWPEREACFSCF
jgi:hypothetical protein